MNNIIKSDPQNIYSPPGNSLAVYVDAATGVLQVKDVNGQIKPFSEVFQNSSGGGTPLMPSVYMGYTSLDTSPMDLSEILDNFNLTVEEGVLPVLFYNKSNGRRQRASTFKYVWKLGAGTFNPIGGENINDKLELIEQLNLPKDDLVIILNGENAEEINLGDISEDFITYMNTTGPYAFTDINKTYVVKFTQNEIEYAYIFQGTLGTYGNGLLQFTEDDFIFIYQSTTEGEPNNTTYVRVTKAEANLLQASASFIVGANYTITDADAPLYGGTEVTLTAITTNQLSLQGSGKFFTPKYDLTIPGYNIWTTFMEGSFTNVVGTFTKDETITAQNGATAIYLAPGFFSWVSGDWSEAVNVFGASGAADVSGFASPSYAIETFVHWGGKTWKNVTGNVGASIDKYTLNGDWAEVLFNATDYNTHIDEIQYDFGNDMIIYRKDRYNNIVSGNNQWFVDCESPDGYDYGNPIKDFQWGNAQDNFNTDDYLYVGTQQNQVIDSYFDCLNSLANVLWLNKLTEKSVINYTTLSGGSGIYYTTLSGGSGINYTTLSGGSVINYTTLSGGSGINFTTLSGGSGINYIIIPSTKIIQKANFNGFYAYGIDISSATYLFESYSKNLFNNSANQPCLSYVDGSNVLQIVSVTA